MKKFIPALFISIAIATSACETVSSAYRIEPAPMVPAGAPRVSVELFEDARPPEEKTGAGAGLFNKSTKDGTFSDPVALGITTALVDELRLRGLDADMNGAAPIRVTGRVRNYRAFIVPPRTAFIPYVSYVTWLWTHDQVSAGVGIEVKVLGPQGVILQKPFTASRNADEWVGIAGLASTARRLDVDTLVKFLRVGLKDCLTKAADEIALAIMYAR